MWRLLLSIGLMNPMTCKRARKAPTVTMSDGKTRTTTKGTERSATSKPEPTTVGGRLRIAVIRIVSPRLLFYTRPLTLALLVAAVTLASTGALFVQIFRECSTTKSRAISTSMGTTAEQKLRFDTMKELEGREGRTTTTIELCLKQSGEMQVVPNPYRPVTLQSSRLVSYVTCTMNTTMLRDLNINWCTDKEADGNTAACDRTNRVHKRLGAGAMCKPCGDLDPDAVAAARDVSADAITQATSVLSFPYLLVVQSGTKVVICPEAFAALGSALGYSLYFELLATFVFVLALKACGYVRDAKSATAATSVYQHAEGLYEAGGGLTETMGSAVEEEV